MKTQRKKTSIPFLSGLCLDSILNEKTDTRIILAHFFDIMVPAAILFGGMALAISLFRSFSQGWYVTAAIHTVMYGFAIVILVNRHKIPAVYLFTIMLAMMFFAFFHALCTMGIASEAFVHLAALGIFSGLFFKKKVAIVIMFLGTLAVVAIGAGVCMGKISLKPGVEQYLYDPATWGVLVFMVLLYVVPLVMVMDEMMTRNQNSLQAAKDLNEQLVEEITVRSSVEKELRKSEAKYRNIFENSIEGIFQFGIDGKIANVNPSLIQMFGSDSAADLVEKAENCFEAFYVDAEARQRLQAKLSQYGFVEGFEARMYKLDNSIIWVSISAKVIQKEHISVVEGTIRDITRRKNLESKLMQTEKMEAIGTFAGGIVHDFNNILTVMSGCSTLMKSQINATDPLAEYVDQMISATEKAMELTQSLLMFSRLQPAVLQPLALNEAVSHTNGILKRLLNRKIILATELSPEPLMIMGVKTQIDQILLNLVSNAQDAMPQGGTITLKTEILEMDEAFILSHGFGKKGRYASISVRDTGKGIDPSILPNIFDPFFTTKTSGKGTGLGLSTVYGIVKQFNGYILADSMPDTGTCFTVYFPILTQEMMTQLKDSAVHMPPYPG